MTIPHHRPTGRHIYFSVALIAATMLLWTFWRFLGVDLRVRDGDGTREVTLVAVILAAVIAAVAALALLWVLRHQALRVWTAVALVSLLISCLGPVLMADSLSAAVALLSFHLLVGVGLIDGVRHLARVDVEV